MEPESDKDDIGLTDENSSGLESAPIDDSSESQSEWEKDHTLIRLESKLENIRHGTFARYGKYVLTVGLALVISGAMINYASQIADEKDSIWFILYLTGNVFFIIGFISTILVLALIAFDYYRSQYIDSLDGAKLAKFQCIHFTTSNEHGKVQSKCAYFDRVLDDDPLCIICPIYKTEGDKTVVTTD